MRMNGRQRGDPATLADALVHRCPGRTAVAVPRRRRRGRHLGEGAKLLLELADADRELSSNLDHDDV